MNIKTQYAFSLGSLICVLRSSIGLNPYDGGGVVQFMQNPDGTMPETPIIFVPEESPTFHQIKAQLDQQKAEQDRLRKLVNGDG